jgi:hemoglobin
MKDIAGKEDIKIFVNKFYGKIREDEKLEPVFAGRIPAENWPKHLERMVSFWNTILFLQREYTGSPFQKHVGLPVDNSHFEHWVELFHKTIDEDFAGKQADEAKRRAENMGKLFSHKLQYLKDNPNFKPIV